MSHSKLIVGTFLTLTATALCVFVSFGPTDRIFQALTAIALAFIVCCPLIHARKDRRRLAAMSGDEASEWMESVYEGPSDTAIATTLGLAVFSLALILLSPSRWPAVLAFGLAFVVMNLIVSPRKPIRNFFVAVAVTFCLLPIDTTVASRLEIRLTSYLARLASDRLDSQNVLNLPDGRTVRTIAGAVPVGLEDGQLAGIRLGAVLGTAMAVYLRRSALHVLLMAGSGMFWAVVLNGFYCYGAALRQNESRSVETLLSVPLIAGLFGFVLLISTDQLWLVLGIFNPFSWIKRDRKRSGRSESAASNESGGPDDSAPVEEEDVQRRVLPAAVFYGIGAVALTIAVLDLGQQWQMSSRNAKIENVWSSAAGQKNRTDVFPSRFGRWALTDAPPLIDTDVPSRGVASVTGIYAAGEKFSRVTYLGPYYSWCDRYLEFQSAGWRQGGQRIVTDEARGVSFVFNEMTRPTGEHCFLTYGMRKIDGDQDDFVPATIRAFRQTIMWELFQSAFFRRPRTKSFYMTEIAFESFGPLTPADSQLFDELIREVMSKPLPEKLRSQE